MIGSSENSVRRVTPRWREYRVAAYLGELGGQRKITKEVATVPNLRISVLQEKFKEAPSVDAVTDLLSAALTASDEAAAALAASYLNAPEISAVAGIKHATARVLASAGNQIRKQQNRIKVLRQRLKVAPADSLAYVDLALAYMTEQIPKPKRAARCLKAALQLAPDDRHVLRSTASYLLSCGRPDDAHAVIVRSDRTSRDPWLSAAEIALASEIGKSSKTAHQALRDVSLRGTVERGASELMSALATLELESGHVRRAKKLYRASLSRPSDNALAQAQWASDSHQLNISLDGQSLQNRYAAEAAARQSLSADDLSAAVHFTRDWVDDQPFDHRASQFGLLLTSSLVDDLASAEKFLATGRRFTPHDPILLNNGAVAYARADQPEVAAVYLRQALAHVRPEAYDNVVVCTATQGLIAFRFGEFESGVELYERSIQLALQHKLNLLAQRATLYFIGEVSRVAPAMAEVGINLLNDLEKNLGGQSKTLFSRECKLMRLRLLSTTTQGSSTEEKAPAVGAALVEPAREKLLDAGAKVTSLQGDAHAGDIL